MSNVVLWDDSHGGPVVELQSTHEDMLRSLEVLRSAETVGDVRNSGYRYAMQVLAQYLAILEEDLGVEEAVTDDDAFNFDLVSDSILDDAPLPHSADVTAEWLGREFLHEHCEISGASPGGNINTYRARDPEAFLQAIRDRGYETVHFPYLLDDYFSAL